MGSTSRPGFLEHLPADRVLESLAKLQRAAWQRPPALQRLLTALRHQNPAAAQNDRTDSDHRPFGYRRSASSYQAAPFTSNRARWTSPPARDEKGMVVHLAESAVRGRGP